MHINLQYIKILKKISGRSFFLMTLHYTAIVILPILRRSNDNGDELGSAYRVGDPRDRSIRHIIA